MGNSLTNLAAETRSSTSLALLSDPELSPKSRRAVSALRLDTENISVQVKDSEIVSGYNFLRRRLILGKSREGYGRDPIDRTRMAKNWPQQVNPRAWRSALCCWTAASNSTRENNCNN